MDIMSRLRKACVPLLKAFAELRPQPDVWLIRGHLACFPRAGADIPRAITRLRPGREAYRARGGALQCSSYLRQAPTEQPN